MYPFVEKSKDVSGSDNPDTSVFIVDVGGGPGQYLESVLHGFPYLPGRFITQDLAANQKPANDRIEAQVYDFFTPQPIKGAKFYFFRSIFHNWPDEQCLSILRNLHGAMAPGYSKLLIHDALPPETGWTRREAHLDMLMMMLGGKKRTKTDFDDLLHKAGFRVTAVYKAQIGSYSIIEAEVDGS